MTYRPAKLRVECHKEILEIRQELVERGLKILPKEIVPEKAEKAFEISGIIEMAIKLLHRHVKEKSREQDFRTV